ncbi:MAG TPA: thioredoxin domain-containing protein [Candidatus Acidoferrales bacterium]|nr:thioredoxin domain-containing protein [Candidatus Acidoferrales bacterium]
MMRSFFYKGKSLNRNAFGILAAACAAFFLFFCVAACVASAAAQTPAEWERLSAEKSLGSPNAPIKMIVYDDYECPVCGELYEQTLRPLIDDYVASGKVYLIHRDFPLTIHLYSRQAARWVNAAARIGKFEAVERAIFDNQMAWSEYGTENPKGIIKPIVESALTAAEFKRVERLMHGCESNSQSEIKGCLVDAGIQRDLAEGELLPVRATPTIVISARGQQYPPMQGVISWPILRQFFDQLLSQK